MDRESLILQKKMSEHPCVQAARLKNNWASARKFEKELSERDYFRDEKNWPHNHNFILIVVQNS